MTRFTVDGDAVYAIRKTGQSRRDPGRAYYFHYATETVIVCRIGQIESLLGKVVEASVGSDHQAGRPRTKITIFKATDAEADEAMSLTNLLASL